MAWTPVIAACYTRPRRGMEEVAPTPPSRAREDGLAALVNLVADGDRDALGQLYDRTSAQVYGLALRILRNEPAAEEITTDIYLQAYSLAPSYAAERGSPLAWLLTIARSRALDRLRADRTRQRREQDIDVALDLASSAAGPEEISTLAGRQRAVRAALGRLPPDQRELIEIAYFAGLSHSEIASKLGQPLGTVKTRIRKGMQMLREALGPFAIGDWA